jgi:hypothetical protein
MKRLFLTSALAIASLIGFSQAPLVSNMGTTITEIVSYPSDLQLDDCNNLAKIEFSVNQDGIIHVNQINACKELKSFLIQKLEGYKLINSKQFVGNTYQYKLIF